MTQINFSMTEQAAKQIKTLCGQDKRPNLALRLRVDGGGCNGFQYHFDLDNTLEDGDMEIIFHDAKVLIDEVSQPFLDNAELDYINEFGGSMFKINNPNATSSCGCGTSFNI